MPLRILAIDPAARTGYAHTNGCRGVWRLGSESPLHLQHLELERVLETAIEAWGCEMLATENAGFGSHNPQVQASHNERLGVIRLVCARHGVVVKEFNPGTIKLFATGDGRAKKPAMIAACRRILGIEVATDDEADACWILALAKRPDCWPEKKERKPKPRTYKTKNGAKRAGRLF